ncbi:MAG TPA: VanZ family protein [Methylomirabilota bacterium]|nr:VanZ family protein [Methylomirabilota bacterium]
MRVPVKPLLATALYVVVLLPLLVTDNDGRPHPRTYLLEFRHGSAGRIAGDAILNVAVFVPLGWLLGRALRDLPVPRPAQLAGVAAVCAALSLGVETLQFFLPTRYSSLIDVLANTGGAVLGAGAPHVRSRP